MDINWFPGHMAKTIRELKAFVNQVDLVLELCDARLPESSRNPELDKLLGDKARLLVMNKADLADPVITDTWQEHYENRQIPVFVLSSLQYQQTKKLYQKIMSLNRHKIEQAEARGRLNRPIRVMVAGIPNTGKSTLINALCGKKAAKTADTPGVTRHITWIRSGRQLELLDSPGLLWPNLGSNHSKLVLAASGAIRDHLLPTEEVAWLMFSFLIRYYPDLTRERYKLNEEEMNLPSDQLFEAAAQKRGCLQSGGRIDLGRFSNLFIDDLREGRLGRISFERPGEVNLAEECSS